LLAHCWVTMIQRYIMFCSRMDYHERGLPGLRENQKMPREIKRLVSC
jgi:hypothetical protein